MAGLGTVADLAFVGLDDSGPGADYRLRSLTPAVDCRRPRPDLRDADGGEGSLCGNVAV